MGRTFLSAFRHIKSLLRSQPLSDILSYFHCLLHCCFCRLFGFLLAFNTSPMCFRLTSSSKLNPAEERRDDEVRNGKKSKKNFHCGPRANWKQIHLHIRWHHSFIRRASQRFNCRNSIHIIAFHPCHHRLSHFERNEKKYSGKLIAWFASEWQVRRLLFSPRGEPSRSTF